MGLNAIIYLVFETVGFRRQVHVYMSFYTWTH